MIGKLCKYGSIYLDNDGDGMVNDEDMPVGKITMEMICLMKIDLTW